MGWQQQLQLRVSPFVHYPQFLPPNAHASLPISSTQTRNYCPRLRAISLHELPPNALHRKTDSNCRCGFSLGVYLGMSRTSLALSKGFSIRPLNCNFFLFFFILINSPTLATSFLFKEIETKNENFIFES